jgi:serine/threonine protein kinase/WD40 repeat protein/energy-coupling factor transporter ATP-binding protein EcfA2
MSNLAGKAIKSYELLERIGAGGFGAVYRAYQSTLGREVAVKVILPGYANRAEFIRRFEIEAQLVARLEHLHIVPLYDYWRDPHGAYLVMRWMRGGSLQGALQEGPFDLGPAALLLDQVAAGLATAHSQGVIHCDLKPPNILLDEEGNAYLADFSIARILRHAEGSLVPKGASDNPFNGISPEQVRGEPVTPQTDIYGLGVLLYEILTGQPPFPEMTPVQRLYKHLNDPLPSLEGFNETVQEGINQVVQKATAKNPKHRFRDALEMAAAFRLAAHLDDALSVQAEALTPREEDILLRIVDGLSNKEIAQELFIELTTVKWYITQIYRKLGVRSRKQAIARMQEARLLVADEAGESVDPAVSVALPEPTNPYKGLRAFDVSDARDFFGREDEIEKLIARLTLAPDPSQRRPGQPSHGAGHFLAIVGPSGSGKSSLVRAGLIPALRRGEVPGSDRWFSVQFVPGSRPLDQLEIALTRVAADQSANLRHHLDRDEHGLLRVADLILPQNDSELLIVIDQFEELFTLVEDEAARAHFLALLATAVCARHTRVRVILTLRADYYDRPLHHSRFGELLRNHMETILPLSAAALERAIVRPAAQVGVNFEPGLVGRMIDDVQYQPGALPLLQYALTELFEARVERLLTHTAYEAIGGLTGALARRAEEPYLEQGGHGREAIRQLFLRLVELDGSALSPDTRRRESRSELIALAANEDVMDELIDTYAAYRLLTLDHDPDSRRPTVEIAHEALLREWQRLRSWLDESRADLRLRRQLTQAAVEWHQAGQDSSFLLRGSRLEQFDDWSQKTELALTTGERHYMQASASLRDERAAAEAARQAREAKLEQRVRRVLQTLAVVFLLATVISGWLALDANRQRGEAERNFARSESQRLAAEANYVLERGSSAELATLLALQGLQAHYTPQADLVLQRAADASVNSVLIEAPGGPFWPLVSPDSRYLRFMRDDPDGSAGRIAELWDLQATERLWQVRDHIMLGYPWTIRDFTADYSAILAINSNDTELVLLDVNSGERVLTYTGNTSRFIHYQLSADGTILVAGTEDGSVHVWNAQNGEEIQRFAVGGEGYTRFAPGRELLVGISPDSRLIAARAAGLTHVWDLESGSELYRFEHEHHGLSPPQFVDDGRLLIATVEPALSLWDLSTGREVEHGIPPVAQSALSRGPQILGILSPDARLYSRGFVGESQKEVGLWDVATGRELQRLIGHSDGAYPVAFLGGGRQIVTWGWEGTARVWDVASGQELLVLAGHTDALMGATLSPDARYLVTAGQDETVRIWDLQALLHQEYRIGGVRDLLHLSPDGRVALTADPDTGATVLVEADSFEVLHQLDFKLDVLTDGSRARHPFSSDGQMVLGVKNSGRILVYDVASGALLGEHSNPDGTYSYAAFVPGSQRIFAGGDGGAYLLDAETGDQLRGFEAPKVAISGSLSGLVAVSPEGRYGALHVWTTDSLNVTYLWELETGVLEFRSTPHPSDVIVAFAFSRDSRYFAWGGTQNTAHVLDLQSGEEVMRLSHLDSVHGMDFSSDNRHLLTSTGGAGVILWDLESGEVVRRFYAGAGQAGLVAFDENDNFALYTTLEDGVIHRQPARIEGLIESACAGLQRDLTAVERQTYGLDDSPTCPKFANR